jgi:CRP/FNR family transcriptional regulator
MNELQNSIVKTCLSDLGKDLLNEIVEYGRVKALEPNEFLVKQGQVVKDLPIVLQGTVKVFTQADDFQFLLYYIYPGATCISSFAHLFGEKGIGFSGVADEKSLVLLIPIQKAREWVLKYPAFNTMILSEYQRQYSDLLETAKQVICYNLEDRILTYLKTRASILKATTMPISHRDIANDMATSREVVSRILKKMERENKIVQLGRQIKLTC